MGTDPCPTHLVACHVAKRAMGISHADGEVLRFPNGGNGARSDWGSDGDAERQAGRRKSFQNRLVATDFTLRTASSKRKSSLPVAESSSICSSHRFCSRRRNHWTMRRYSSGDRPSIAASISSTRLMPGVYHRPAPDFIDGDTWSQGTPAARCAFQPDHCV